jgi:DNA-binding GntR family transcriptional regulator
VPEIKEIRDRYTLREALEAQSARLFVERAGEKEKAEILQGARQLDLLYACCRGGPVEPELRLTIRLNHVRFHLRVAEIAGSALLQRAIEREQDLLFSWLSDSAAHAHPLPEHYHEDLATALCSGDPLAADTAIRRHIRYAMEELLELMQPATESRWRARARRAG